MDEAPEQWLLWEQIILSDQMESDQVQKLLTDEPEFARWLKERAEARQNGKSD